MSAPVAGYIQLPDDSGNSGKKAQYQSESIGGNTVYAPYVITRRSAKVLGLYRLATGQNTILATAHTPTSTAFLYMFNPVANTGKNIRIRRAWINSINTSALATPTGPRVLASRSTFTGTASGSALTPDKVASANPASSAYFSAVITGATVASMVSSIGAAHAVQCVTAVGAMSSTDNDLMNARDNEDEFEVLAAGECAVFWQDVNGTSSDTRKANINIVYDEIDIT